MRCLKLIPRPRFSQEWIGNETRYNQELECQVEHIVSFISSPKSWAGTRLHVAGACATVEGLLARVQPLAIHIGGLYLEQRVHAV